MTKGSLAAAVVGRRRWAVAGGKPGQAGAPAAGMLSAEARRIPGTPPVLTRSPPRRWQLKS